MFYNLKLRLKVRSQFSSLYYSITICTVQANAFRAIVAGPFIIAEKDAEFGGGIFCFFISCGQRASRYLLTMCKADENVSRQAMEGPKHYDQMAVLFFKIGPFIAIEIGPKA